MRKMRIKKSIRSGLIALGVLLVLSVCLGLFSSLTILESFRIVFGSIYVLFLPGFIISFIFFKETKEFDSREKDAKSTRAGVSPDGQIDWIERIALSFALSIAIVPLVVFYLNLVGVRINLLNSFLTILGIIIFSLGILYWKKKKSA